LKNKRNYNSQPPLLGGYYNIRGGAMTTGKEEVLSKIDLNKVPEHVAIIMDGNGRWARRKGLPRVAGHRAGVESIREVIKTSLELGIKIITLFAFSTENWKRPRKEVNFLMDLPREYLHKELKTLKEKQVRINMMGRWEGIPEKTLATVKKGMEETSDNDKLVLNFALNYGGRTELIDAVKKIAVKIENNELSSDNIDEETINDHLYTKDFPDPALIIRPSGEKRVSNFLLWQMAYSEFWFCPIYWPDFRGEHLLEAVYEYQTRKRRFGKIKH